MTDRPSRDVPDESAAAEGQGDDDGDWRERYAREAAQSRRYRKRAQAAEAECEALRAGMLDEEERARLEAWAEEGRKAEARTDRLARLEAMVETFARRDALVRALAAHGVGRGAAHGPDMIEQAVRLLADAVEVDTSGEKPLARVKAGPDAPPHGGTEDVAAYVARWLSGAGAHFLPPTGDTGSGARPGAGGEAPVPLAQLDADPRKKAKFIAQHGPTAYVQLARKTRS